ncbi:MAG: hypothetical protein ACQEWG_06105 [Bacteroidota bacterium]
MKKLILPKITATALFFLFTFVSVGQISLSQEEVIEQYGLDFREGIFEGNSYLLYTNPTSTKSSGFFIIQKIMFFKKSNDGNAYCYKFQLVEPVSEMKINIDIYNRDLNQVGFQHWIDLSDGVHYRIEERENFSLITAWVNDETPEISETSFF